MIFLLKLSLVIVGSLMACTGAFAETVESNTSESATSTLPNPASIPLGWIFEKFQQTKNESPEYIREKLKKEILAKQNEYSTIELNRKEFLDLYLSVLKIFGASHNHVNPSKFIEATSDFLLTLNLSYEEIINLILAGESSNDAVNAIRSMDRPKNRAKLLSELVTLQPFRGLLLARLLKNQAPEHIQKLLQISMFLGRSSEFIAGAFPAFAHLEPGESLLGYQIALYQFAVWFVSKQDTIALRNNEGDVPEVKIFSEFYQASGNYLYQLGLSADHIANIAQHADPEDFRKGLRFVQFHLRQHAASLGTQGVKVLSVRYLEMIRKEFSNVRNHGPSNEKDWAEILSDFLEHTTDPEIFSEIFLLHPKMLRAKAELRQDDFLRWLPSMETLKSTFGGEHVRLTYLSHTITPSQFILLLQEVLLQNRWQSPTDFNNLLAYRMPYFLSTSPGPTDKEVLEVLTLIRHRPAPTARALLERAAVEKSIPVNNEDVIEKEKKKRLFLNLASYELTACTKGVQCLDLKTSDDRQALRMRLENLLGPAMPTYYPNLSEPERRAHLFCDLLMHDEIPNERTLTPLLLVLADELTPATISVISQALSQAPFPMEFLTSNEQITSILERHRLGLSEGNLLISLQRKLPLAPRGPLPVELQAPFAKRSILSRLQCNRLVLWAKAKLGKKK